MPFLFSYGTLQQEEVQVSTFGRRLSGEAGVLPGFERSSITIDGTSYFTLTFTGNRDMRVPGIVFEITDSELARADAYEGDFYYKRVIATLESGKQAWVYVRNTLPELMVIDDNGLRVVEARSEQPLSDIDRLIEVCMSERVLKALLHASNLPPAFFDLSSGTAGAILQKLRNYRVRLAVVYEPGATPLSSRFEEAATEEKRRGSFGLFVDRPSAREWLSSSSPSSPLW